MTQPPPPPHQPPPGGGFGPPQDQPPQQPGGGFGAPQPQQQPAQPPQPPAQPPQAPPAGGAPGYGYPHTPQGPPAPPQPAYGYPQAPQGAPQTPPPPAPPGYGHPGQQPGAYGQPQNPYGQQPPGYGYPQPNMPMHPQPAGPGGGRKFNTQLAVIVAAVVAIALVIGGVVLYKQSGDEGGKDDTASSSGGTGGGDDNGGGGASTTPGKEKVPADPNSQVLFQIPSPAVPDDTVVTVAGSWLTDKAYVKSGVNEIVGYDPEKGTELWTIPLPGPVCQASKRTNDDNLTAIAFEPAKPTKEKPSHGCTQVAAIDLDAGKKLWTKTAEVDGEPIRFDNITVSGGTVAAGGTSGGAAFDIESGKQLWIPKPNNSCYDLGYAGGEKLVAVGKCGGFADPQLHIQTIDQKTGRVISEYKMAEGVDYASVISTEPLVVAAEVGQSKDAIGITDVFSIDNKTGKLRIRISVPGDQFAARCSGTTAIEACTGIVVGNDRLYVETEEHQGGGEYGRTNEIVAFDLATGKQTGQRADAGDRYTITPLRMDGGNIIAYKRPPYDKGGQIVSIDGGSFKETKLLENPAARTVRDVETRMQPESAEIVYVQGRLYMAEKFASALGSSFQKRYHVIAFGRSEG